MNVLLILNDAPYGSERSYNALRLAMALQKEQAPETLRVFLMADAVGCAVAEQATPQGYYNVERMLRSVLLKGGAVSLCGTCADARGPQETAWVEGAQRGSMSELAQWTAEAERVPTF